MIMNRPVSLFCDWSDSDSRSELINGLVGDGLAVLKAMDGVDLDTEQADAVGLLAVVGRPRRGTRPRSGRQMADRPQSRP